MKTCWPKKSINLTKKINVEKSKYSRHHQFIQPIDKSAGKWWTKRTSNAASLMVLAAVGVGARTYSVFLLKPRNLAIRCSRKFWTQKLLLYGEHNCVLVQNNTLPLTNISTLSLITGWQYFGLWGMAPLVTLTQMSKKFLHECRMRFNRII